MRQFILVLVLTVGVLSQTIDFTGHRLITMKATSKEQLELLASLEESTEFEELDFWAGPSLVGNTDIRVSPSDYGRLRNILTTAGLNTTVLNENIQGLLDEEARAQAKAPRTTGCSHLNVYCTFSQIEVFLIDIESRYPNNVQRTIIGYSFEGRPLYQIKIAEDLYTPKDAVWIEAGTHAREWISVSSGLEIIARLAANTEDITQTMLEKYDWYIIPVHNPDGYVYSHVSSQTRLWRKNRQSCSGRNIGIDLNRNWDADFGGAGTSNFCSSDVYRGAYAFEAPETAALRDAVLNTPNVFAFFSIHAYSQYMLIPYAFTSSRPDRYDELFAVAEHMMKYLETVDGTYFVTGTPPDILYAAAGGAYDYFYLQGVPYSYTYELRPRSGTSNGFVLNPVYIPVATEEVMVSLGAFVSLGLQWP